MSPAEKIKKIFVKSNVTVSSELDDRIMGAAYQAFEKSEKTKSTTIEPNILRIIMKSRITQFASAAVITLVLIISINSFDDSVVWADVIKTLNETNNVYFKSKMIFKDGKIISKEFWLKNKTMLRENSDDEVVIDDSHNRLILNKKEKTAEFMDSFTPFEDYMSDGLFELLLLFTDEEAITPFEAELIPDDAAKDELVFEVTYHNRPFGTVWVDSKTSLPFRMESSPLYHERVLRWEAVFDYQPIALEVYDQYVPEGYVELTRRISPQISGSLIDEQGQPIADAWVYCPKLLRGIENGLWTKTDNKGEFVFTLASFHQLPEMPFMIRAFPENDPSRVGCMIIQDPCSLKLYEQGTIHSWSIHLNMDIRDVNALYHDLGGDSGKFIFGKNGRPREITDVLLQMSSARVISGRVTDIAGWPVTKATVSIDRMEMKLDRGNQLMISDLGDHSGGRKLSAMTNHKGDYFIGNVPLFKSESRCKVGLIASADGFVTIEKEIELDGDGQCYFELREAELVVRGILIDDYGNPLECREIDICMEEKEDDDEEEEFEFEIEQAVTDKDGRFELYNIPFIKGLCLEVCLDNPYIWRNNWDDKYNIEKDERSPEFTYYKNMVVPIPFEKNKKQYWVEIVPHQPDITITVEVKDNSGQPIQGIPVIPYGIGFSDIPSEWALYRLMGITDENGVYVMKGLPRFKGIKIAFSKIPESFIPFGYDDKPLEYWHKRLAQETIDTLRKSSQAFLPHDVQLDFNRDQEEYNVSVVLQYR